MPQPPKTHLPDAVKDGERRRERRVMARAGITARLLAAADGGAVAWLVVPIDHVPGGDFYSHAFHNLARDLAAEVIGTAPAWVTLQRGREGGAHLNILMPRAALTPALLAELPSGSHVASWGAWDMDGLVCYLSGPADQRASRWKHPETGRRHRPTAAEKEQAAADYLAARQAAGGRRLPRMSWGVNLPRLSRQRLDNTLRVLNYVTPPGRPRQQTRVMLAQAALDRGLSTQEAAAHAGVSKRQVQRWLSQGHVTRPSAQPSLKATAEAEEVTPTPPSVTASTPASAGPSLKAEADKGLAENRASRNPCPTRGLAPINVPASPACSTKTTRTPPRELARDRTRASDRGGNGRGVGDSRPDTRQCDIPVFFLPRAEGVTHRPRPP